LGGGGKKGTQVLHPVHVKGSVYPEESEGKGKRLMRGKNSVQFGGKGISILKKITLPVEKLYNIERGSGGRWGGECGGGEGERKKGGGTGGS